MATTSNSTINALLKNVYKDIITECVNNEFEPWKRFQRVSDKVDFSGNTVIFEVAWGRSPAVGAGLETAALPTAGTYNYKQVAVDVSFQRATHEWSDMIIKRTKGKLGSFANTLKRDMKSLKNDLVHDIARQMFGSGNSVITTLSAVSDGANPTIYCDNVAMFDIGMQIIVTDGSFGTRRSAGAAYGVITAVDRTNKTLTTTGWTTASTAVGDYVCRYGTFSGSTSYEMTGLQQVLSKTATLHGLDVATYPWWVPTIHSNSGVNRALTLTMINKLLHEGSEAGAYPSMFYMSSGVMRSMMNLLQARQRYVNESELQGGVKVKAYMGDDGPIPMMYDRFIPKNRIMGLMEEHFGVAELGGGPDWLQEDGSILHWKSGYAIWEVAMVYYPQICCFDRTKQLQLSDITEE